RHANDTLDASVEHAEATALELMSFCRRLGVPFGISIESVSIRKQEIEASVRLAGRLETTLVRLSGRVRSLLDKAEADDGARTRDPELGKLVLYQLSYVRAGAKS